MPTWLGPCQPQCTRSNPQRAMAPRAWLHGPCVPLSSCLRHSLSQDGQVLLGAQPPHMDNQRALRLPATAAAGAGLSAQPPAGTSAGGATRGKQPGEQARDSSRHTLTQQRAGSKIAGLFTSTIV